MDYRPGTQRRLRQPALPRRDDVRRLRQHRSRRLDPDHPRSVGRRVNFIDTAVDTPPESPRRSWARRSRTDGATASCSPSSSAFPSMAMIPTTAEPPDGGSPRLSTVRCAGPAPTGSTSIRWASPTRTPMSTRPSAPSLTSCTPARSGPSARRRFPLGDRRGPMAGRPPWLRAVSHRAAPPPTPRGPVRSSTTCCRPRCATEWACWTFSSLAGGWLSGKYRKGRGIKRPGSAARAQRFPGAYDATNPSNAAKLDAADALGELADEAGLTLIQMATAFTTRHPTVTSAIIEPRTMELLEAYLAAAGVDLSEDVLDRIDEIVAPGETVNVADNMWSTPALDDGFRRRRRQPQHPEVRVQSSLAGEGSSMTPTSLRFRMRSQRLRRSRRCRHRRGSGRRARGPRDP